MSNNDCRAGYFASMPERENLPVFWSDAELECLEGTALLDDILQDKSDVLPIDKLPDNMCVCQAIHGGRF